MASMNNDDKRVQKEVARAAGTTEVTLRNRLRGIEEALTPQEVSEEAPVDAGDNVNPQI